MVKVILKGGNKDIFNHIQHFYWFRMGLWEISTPTQVSLSLFPYLNIIRIITLYISDPLDEENIYHLLSKHCPN